MGSGNSKGNEQGPQFKDDFYGKSHKRLGKVLSRQFANGVKYNSNITYLFGG